MTHSDFNTIILAAGNGTRMNSSIPKTLHEICGASMLSLILASSSEAGSKKNYVIVPENHQEFLSHTTTNSILVTQKEANGTGDAVLKAEKHIKENLPLVVINGDTPLIESETLKNLIQSHTTSHATITITTCNINQPENFGRIIRDQKGKVHKIVEESNLTKSQKSINEINCGIYCFDLNWIWNSLKNIKTSSTNELFLTDLIEMAYKQNKKVESISPQKEYEITGVNTLIDLSKAEKHLRQKINYSLMSNGVKITDPDSTYIDINVTIGQDTIIKPNSHIYGNSSIGENCIIGPTTQIYDSKIGHHTTINSSLVKDSTIENYVEIGPSSHIRDNSIVGDNARIGTNAEIKNTTVGSGTKSGHFSYLGDSKIGQNVNIGAGTITCNFDGQNKHETIIGDDTFIGSDSLLIAPINIGKKVITGAGSVVNKDIPDNSKAIGFPVKILKSEFKNGSKFGNS